MKGDTKILQHLNNVLRNELTAINQYFLHSRMLLNWGLGKLGKHEYEEAIEEMHHADKLIQRLLFLEGIPNMQTMGKLHIGESVKQVLENDLNLEIEAVAELKGAIGHAEQVGDFVSRDLFRQILTDEEGHIDHLETELSLIGRIGLANYEQSQI